MSDPAAPRTASKMSLRISPSACERAAGAKPGSEHIVARLKAMDKDGNGEVRTRGGARLRLRRAAH